ncbi:MAG: DUF1549 and DUF1553 domain-containing protein, partial [Planctomycetota bacterium]
TDSGRQMWLWRDWVIEAFRQNMPYDRFLTEQLAGDLLPDATIDQLIASGFNRNHVVTDEGGAIDEEYLVEYAVDRTDTTSAVFLGLTIACARCHDHKYDPISAEDYYGLFAYFNSNDEPGLYTQDSKNPHRAYEPAISVLNEKEQAEIDRLNRLIATYTAQTEKPTPEAIAARDILLANGAAAAAWVTPIVEHARSSGGSTLEILDDRSVRATGTTPDTDVYQFELASIDTPSINAALIEVMTDESIAHGRVGRSDEGNAVLTGIDLWIQRGNERIHLDPAWAWADIEQANVGYPAIDALRGMSPHGWGVDGKSIEGGRRLLIMLTEPFDLQSQDRLGVRMAFQSKWSAHSFVRVRTNVGIYQPVIPLAPAFGNWHRIDPFVASEGEDPFDTAFGPEASDRIDPSKTFGNSTHRWMLDADLKDGSVARLPGSPQSVLYFGREVFAHQAIEAPVSLSSNHGFRLFVNGYEIASNRVERGVESDRKHAVLPLRAGQNTVVLKVIHTGDPAEMYFNIDEWFDGWNDTAIASLPEKTINNNLRQRAIAAWDRSPSSPIGQALLRLDEARAYKDRIKSMARRTMVMSELDEPRQTYVLTRGEYNHPDLNRPVQRGVPSALGELPEGAEANRLGLARWMTGPENPLVSRVAVNRFWMMLFGNGLVRTPEDFGFQGDWPTHPELLDRLAVDLRESGWDIRELLRQIVLSATYRQSSAFRPDVFEIDPDNRLLARYPSRRLWAEQIRDQALFQAGLLVEDVGGPGVKPYQPEGLWREVAMDTSTTKEFVRDNGDDLYRRSLYTYWKRAAPPPSMRAFDAPTREFCTIQRATTETPLQALVLWNDEQFVEAARVLAQRTLKESDSDTHRMISMYRRCASARPTQDELKILTEALAGFRERFSSDRDAARSLLDVGEAPIEGEPAEVAAWTMLASTMMNMYRVTTQE